MNRSLATGVVSASIAVFVLSIGVLSQQDAAGLLERALQKERQVDTVEVQLRVEVNHFRYAPEQMRQWGFSEDLIHQAKKEMGSLPEKEVVRLRLRFDNRNKLFEGVQERPQMDCCGESTADWKVLRTRSLVNNKAVVNYQETQSKRGDVRKDLSRSAVRWPPLGWLSEIWRYRIWHSHLPGTIDNMHSEISPEKPSLSNFFRRSLKIEPIPKGRQEYAIKFGNVLIVAQHSQDGFLLRRYTAVDEVSGYPEYEQVIAYRQTEEGLPYPAHVVETQYLVPPKEYLKDLRIPKKTPVRMAAYTVEGVQLNPVFDKQTFEEGDIPRGTFVQDDRFEPPLVYTQGSRQFSEKDLLRMAQNRELLQDADWMGYRPRPARSTYVYFAIGLALAGIALWLLSRAIGRDRV